MDKKGRKSDQGPRNISHRSRNLFNSIINLTPLGIKTPAPQRLSPADLPSSPTDRKQNNDTINLSTKKRKSASSQSSCSSLSSSGGGGGGVSLATPSGPAPKTFSILTALNELSISEDLQCVNSSRKNGNIASKQIRSGSWVTPRNKCRIRGVPQDSTIPTNNAPHLISLDQVVGREKFGRRKQPTPCQQTKASELLSHNGLIKSHQTRTPEWIRKIFRLARHGNLNELVESLKGLNLTVIRHLADCKGRTLLHAIAGAGKLSVLKWVVSTLGPLADAGLNDHDEEGRTPVLLALKKRRVECFQWLVLTTKAGHAALVAEEGERSLLHFAARYGDLIAVRWLSKCLKERGKSLDMKDISSGATPLCEAAQAGNLLVCHELILAGADPLYQTELGWRPVDFAISQRRLECVNYLMMAETAASVGNELHLRQKQAQIVQEEHNSLCNNFQELLRVGKWLVKERTDLIKNFSSIGLKTPEASILLGESRNGTRFSDLEHKLVQAEQASRHLIKSNSSGFKSSLANDNTFNLLDILASAQSRCEKMLLANASNVSEEQKEEEVSCDSSASSSDTDDTHLPSYVDINKFHKQRVGTKYIQKCFESPVAPWLLASSDDSSMIAQLSPLVNQLDLLDTPAPQPPHTTFLKHTQHGQVDIGQKMRGQLSSVQSLNDSSSSQPTVVEVIEPHSSECIKGTPDLIRGTTCGDSVSSGRWLKKEEGRPLVAPLDESIYSEIKGSSSIPLHCDFTLDEFVATSTPFHQQQQQSFTHPLTNKHQKHQSYSRSREPEVRTAHPSSQISFPSQEVDALNSKCVQSRESKSPEMSGKLESDSADQSAVSLFKSETSAVIESSPANSQLSHTFPVQVSMQVSEHLLFAIGSQDDISCGGNLLYVPPQSISTSTTPVMLPYSHASNTVLFPFKKGKWLSPDEPSLLMNTPHSFNTGKLSPSPSESSRTETALAPLPSNASHGSHTSELSKTESARDIPHEEDETRNETREEESEIGEMGTIQDYKICEGEEESNQCRKMSLGSSLNVQNAQSIIRPLVSSSIHKVSVHHVTKRGRRQSKAWYEVEGSDDENEEEGTSLVRKIRSRSTRSSSKLSNSSPSNSSEEKTENDSETSQEHECDPSCAQHNCPDFV